MTVIEITNEIYYCDTTIELEPGDLLRGTGNKHCQIRSTASPIIQVNSNSGENGDWSHTSVIENIGIVGNHSPLCDTQTAIYLEDVYGCQIRNVSIGNCGTGIKLYTNDAWMHGNHIEHVRMEWVNRGIHFAKRGMAYLGDFGFTHIADTSIRLTSDSEEKHGIQVDYGCKVHNSFIKANVWLDNPYHAGMIVNGELKYDLMHLTVENLNDSGPTGFGIYLQSNAVINNQGDDYNQQLFLAGLDLYEYVYNEAGVSAETIVVQNIS